MALLQRRSPLIGLILLTCGQSAFGGSYADPSGFSFRYPDGWIPVTRATMGDLNQVLPGEVKDWISRNRVDLNRLQVVLIRAGRDEFLESLNVVVDNQQIPVNDDTAKKLTSTIAQKYGAMGVKVDDVQGRVQKVGSYDAVVVEYQAQMPGVPETLRQRQVLFPGGGKTFIVTCTAKANSFDKYQPTFDTVLASFQVPAPVAQGFDWDRVETMTVVGGLIGGLIGGLAWVAKKFSSKAGPKQGSDRTPDAGKP
jgi:hypothetical protein